MHHLVPVALALLLALPAAAAAQRDCDCTDLPELQRELDNAIRLQRVFRESVAELRGHGPGASQIAFQQVAQGAWARSGARGSGRHQHNVATSLYGSDVDSARFGEQTPERRAQLCQPTGNMQRELAEAMRGAACRGIAEALRRHEQHHVSACVGIERGTGAARKVGYPAWIEQSGAEFAEQEVAAYEAQIRALRAEVGRVMRGATVHLEGDTTISTAFPGNPLYSAINMTVRRRVELRLTEAAEEAMQFAGEGTEVVGGTIVGRCRYTSGLPYTLPARATLRADGLAGQLDYGASGMTPAIGMTCDIPGAGRVSSTAPPTATGGEIPGGLSIALVDGAEWRQDATQSEAARMLAAAGARMTGETRLRVRLECAPPR